MGAAKCKHGVKQNNKGICNACLKEFLVLTDPTKPIEFQSLPGFELLPKRKTTCPT